MKWFVVLSIFVTVSRCSDGKELSSISQTVIEDQGAKCTAGSEWERDCYKCTCPDSVAQCVRIAECDRENPGRVQCKAGSSYYQDCNQCVCSKGLLYCTIMGCVHESPDIVLKSPSKAHMSPNKQCAPGTKWKSQCRDCECSEFGVASCELKECPGHNNEPLFQCAPGSNWKNDCNGCGCTSSGLPYCTRKGCIEDLDLNMEDDLKRSNKKAEDIKQLSDIDGNSIHSLIRRSVCKPNQNFQNDCNTCKCAADGLSYKCTQNECMDKEDSVNKEVEVFMENEGVDHIERHSVCQPRGTFYIGCNTCHCNNFGTDYSCTNKPCPLPEDVELFHELKAKSTQSKGNKTIICPANKMFIKDCNTCWCNEDGTTYSCTRRVCLHDLEEDDAKLKELRVILRQCRPNMIFELDCNNCRCNPDGDSYTCTRSTCAQETPVEPLLASGKLPPLSRIARATAMDTPGPRKACDPGQEFRVDCNKCLCDNEGQDFSCTRNDCRTVDITNAGPARRRRREVARQAVNKCEPGSVFQQDCNVCRCTSDGHHATCTLKRCSLKPDGDKNKQDDSKSESDPNFRCNPGEQFKRGCDDCTCSADGKSVFCTLLLCDKEVYES